MLIITITTHNNNNLIMIVIIVLAIMQRPPPSSAFPVWCVCTVWWLRSSAAQEFLDWVQYLPDAGFFDLRLRRSKMEGFFEDGGVLRRWKVLVIQATPLRATE